jgi:isocitrate dehydrogenase kinase/phosphatase
MAQARFQRGDGHAVQQAMDQRWQPGGTKAL